MLISWEIGNERNARTFQNKQAPSTVIVDKIKREARLWITIGAKRLSELMPRALFLLYVYVVRCVALFQTPS
jgi:hypothetical protein